MFGANIVKRGAKSTHRCRHATVLAADNNDAQLVAHSLVHTVTCYLHNHLSTTRARPPSAADAHTLDPWVYCTSQYLPLALPAHPANLIRLTDTRQVSTASYHERDGAQGHASTEMNRTQHAAARCAMTQIDRSFSSQQLHADKSKRKRSRLAQSTRLRRTRVHRTFQLDWPHAAVTVCRRRPTC